MVGLKLCIKHFLQKNWIINQIWFTSLRHLPVTESVILFFDMMVSRVQTNFLNLWNKSSCNAQLCKLLNSSEQLLNVLYEIICLAQANKWFFSASDFNTKKVNSPDAERKHKTYWMVKNERNWIKSPKNCLTKGFSNFIADDPYNSFKDTFDHKYILQPTMI